MKSALKRHILESLKETPTLTQKELQEQLCETRAHVQEAIKEMVNGGVLERKGGKRLAFGKFMNNEHYSKVYPKLEISFG